MAAVWTVFIAWIAGVRVPWMDPAAMFLAVWILYAADRLLDAKPLFNAPSCAELEERHRFHHRHRKAFFAAILCAAIPLVVLLHRTSDAVLHLDVLLASLLGIWLLLVHARPAPSSHAHRLPKELAVGVFFPAAVFIPTVARAPSLRSELALSAVCFALLCTLNCLFLCAWEHPGGGPHAHASTRWAVHYLRPLAVVACCLEGLFIAARLAYPAGLPMSSNLAHPEAPLLACAVSSMFLLLLNSRKYSLPAITLRALADLVLLTPIPVGLILLFASRSL